MDLFLPLVVVILMICGALAFVGGLLAKFYIRVIRRDKRPTTRLLFFTLGGAIAFAFGTILGQFTA